MWYLEKDVTISASHRLVNYKGACNNLHGHNWNVTIYCKAEKLSDEGMVLDFKKIKEIVNELDHADLNEKLKLLNPTAEVIAAILKRRYLIATK